MSRGNLFALNVSVSMALAAMVAGSVPHAAAGSLERLSHRVEVGAFDPSGTHYGGMLEDLVLVKKDGIENLTAHLSHDLYVAK